MPLRLLALALLLGFPTSAAAQRLRIVVGGANFRPYPVAVAEMVVTGGKPKISERLARELTQLARVDVDLARSLELVPPKTYLEGKEVWPNPSFPSWTHVGASGLVWGGLESDG